MSEPAVLGTLIVIFIKARNLTNKRKLGKQNPYCIARIGHEAKRSPADIRGGQTPGWDHEVRFEIKDLVEHKQLKLSVLDENDSKPELVGDTVISLEEAFNNPPSQGYDLWHELKLKGKFAGEVYLEMTYYPNRPNLPPKPKKKKKPKKKVQQEGSRPLPMQPGSVASSNSSNSVLTTASIAMPELPEEFEQTLRLDPSPSPPSPPQHHYHPPPQMSQTPQPYPSSRTPLPPIPQPPASAPPDGSRVKRKPVPQQPQQSNQTVPRKPINAGLPHTPEFDGGLDEIPFSPDDYNTMYQQKLNQQRQQQLQQEHQSTDVLDSSTYAPEPVIPQNRPPKRLPSIPGPVPVDPGITGYSGEGQWNVDQINAGFNDSIFNRVIRGHMAAPEEHHEKPQLPPKIPMGMTREEYYATEPLPEEEEDPYYYRVYA